MGLDTTQLTRFQERRNNTVASDKTNVRSVLSEETISDNRSTKSIRQSRQKTFLRHHMESYKPVMK